MGGVSAHNSKDWQGEAAMERGTATGMSTPLSDADSVILAVV